MGDSSVFGIDLGTTNSCIAVWKNGEVLIVPNEIGQKTTPSCVAFTETGYLVGNTAIEQQTSDPSNSIVEAKRIIGQDRKYIEKELQYSFNNMKFEDRPKYDVKLEGQSKLFYPEEISSIVLNKLKEIAEEHIKQEVKDVVITIPAYFNDKQREATKVAGKIAGLNVLKLIAEPVAAALAFGFSNGSTAEEQNILIYDLGGGTFDIAIVSIDSLGSYDVRATNGNTRLGGIKFTDRLVKFVNEKLKETTIDTKRYSPVIRNACDKAKNELSTVDETSIDIADERITITRGKYEELIMSYIDSTINCVQNALDDAELEKEEIHQIVLIGGSTYTPLVRSSLQKFFGKPVNTDINPMEAVAYGACVQAAVLQRKEGSPPIYVRNVTPLTIGVNASGGKFAPLIKRNKSYPTQTKLMARTSRDDQTRVKIHLLEGENPKAFQNRIIGRMSLDGLQASPKGNEKIQISMKIDEKGIITASATDKRTKIVETITIDKQHQFTEDEILTMKNTVAQLQKGVYVKEDKVCDFSFVPNKRIKMSEDESYVDDVEVCPVYGFKNNEIVHIELE